MQRRPQRRRPPEGAPAGCFFERKIFAHRIPSFVAMRDPFLVWLLSGRQLPFKLALVVAWFAAASGCAKPPRTVEVLGRVTHNGVPVEGALVVFFGAEQSDDMPAAGITDASGHYELRTYFSAHDIPLGAIPNDYAVSIQKYKRPQPFRVLHKMPTLHARDLKRYLAEEAVHDLWPDGVPDGWPDGYIPTVNLMPKHVFDNEEWRNKVSRLEHGIPLLPTRYADPGTSGFRAAVEWSGDGPLTFDFDLTGEIDEDAPLSTTETELQFGLSE